MGWIWWIGGPLIAFCFVMAMLYPSPPLAYPRNADGSRDHTKCCGTTDHTKCCGTKSGWFF